MGEKIDVSVIILTYNEEKNIETAIKSVVKWADEVIILDSGSQDGTIDLCNKYDVKIRYREFDNYANQRRYAIKEIQHRNEWIFFLDADEYLPEELKSEIKLELNDPEYDGYYIKYRFYFLGKWIKYGSYYGTEILRLFKKTKADVSRDMNEHIFVDGKVGKLKNDFIHEDKKGISEWIIKHNKYATYEAKELIKFSKPSSLIKTSDNFGKLNGNQAQRKRWIREKIWNRLLPPLVRPFIYFSYRYFIRLGLLDGKTGLIFHFLHGLWYPLLIDVKYLEMKKKCAE
ncbi:glycosyltransferase family 2 protein [Gramella sp. KN1008]|uniref:glycosyltransferase family 2 protein n=1 Tax=Gramella sp. KN1008 TaxID=2529298 RepID=UPI00103A6E67|nr:glycosyltransferase family 2 protein [Gramella sp. KN1008]TBW30124.1 glycosyltransferase family 2 protein [Gramella sp. KN1008]